MLDATTNQFNEPFAKEREQQETNNYFLLK